MVQKTFGAPLKSREDPQMLQGESPYTADIKLPGMLHMAILRSEYAHAKIKHIDTSEALKMPGVVRVITGDDLTGKIMPLPCIWIPGGVESHFPPHPFGLPGAGDVLAKDRVRFIGDSVAAVVAETRYQAYDALAGIHIDYEPLPVVVDPEDALKEGAPLLHDAVPHNLNADWTCGDKAAADKAIAEAEVVVNLSMYNQRTINNPLEPRSAIGNYDPVTEDYTLWATTQSPHNHRFLLSVLVLGIPFNKLRVIAPTIGGSFGTKGYIYPDMALVLFLSKELERPVKWVDTRNGLMRSTVQGRDHKQHATIAGTKDGKITGLRCTSYANLGAYPSTIGPGVATALMGRSLSGPYTIENAFCEVFAVFTNIVPLGAQRGSGRAEATFLMERLVDLYAAEIGMDPAEVRRKNMVPPDQFPYDNHLGWTYDSGNYGAALERALEMVDYAHINERKAEASRRGKRLGVGIASFVAICGVGPSTRMSKEGMLGGTWESANIRVHPSGEVGITLGSKSTGQSHVTTFAQIAAEELGVDMDNIRVYHSDTQKAPYGQGTYGSRSYSVGGPAMYMAAQKIKEKIRKAAAHMFEAAEEDVVYEGGKVFVKDTPQKVKTFQEMAMALWYGWNLPAGMEPTLDETSFFDPADFNYPFGTHIAVIEIDNQTGQVDLVRYVAVNDAGPLGNPLVVNGQVEGSITHGAGQALIERAVYDEQGILLTDSFTSYAIPRSTDLPEYELDYTVTPSPHNALGVKGAGEIATVPPAAAIGNAVCDALADLGIKHIDMPFTAEKIWRVMRDAEQKKNAASNGHHV
ncbi:xanthine dehydrogenase family protein molybdopterin-binding subunit [Dictyobacter arantiisoli]|uniref:Aldehyde dehydrogenase n=1 Tax=Dictyobacter arantiisoli TaxID=2014874 RepID=A0A5A5T8Z9_9CHLR|nr:xanthine dehydrogenase family protein molybdopterin-binding subunit [Dictyobacter arantiisoli]GCF07961.1 aldehyde dehydrogenase [Dictyobacter arantiisoli]